MLIDGPRFVLTRRELMALLAFASEDETRPHVCGVGFSPTRGTAAATTGHYIAELSSERGHPLPPEFALGTYEAPDFVVPRGALTMALRATGKDDAAGVDVHPSKLIVHVDKDTTATIPLSLMTADLKPKVTFPPYAPLFDKANMDVGRDTAIAVALNPKYLALIAAVGDATGEEMVTVHMPSSFLDPLLVTVESWRVLIMPGRIPETALLQGKRDAALSSSRRDRGVT